MRSLTAAGVLVLAASVVACTDSLTEPELSDGPLLQGRAPTIVVTCGFEGDQDSELSERPVVLPDDRDRLEAFRTECLDAGGHLVFER